MKIVRKVTDVNGSIVVTYPYNGKEYEELSSRLRAEFSNQGEFYEKAFGVIEETAEKAGWSPQDINFHVGSSGWVKFLADKGTINHVISIEEVEMSSILLF